MRSSSEVATCYQRVLIHLEASVKVHEDRATQAEVKDKDKVSMSRVDITTVQAMIDMNVCR